MQCPRCEFENIPGQSRCLKCGASLETKAEDFDPHPPRMPYWKRPIRNTFRFLRRFSMSPGIDINEDVPAWIQKIRGSKFLAFFLSILPGLGHFFLGRFRDIVLWLGLWLLLLGLGLWFWGGFWGILFLAFSVMIHAWIAIDCLPIRETESLAARFGLIVVLGFFIFLIYRMILLTAFHDIRGGYISLTIPAHLIESGDYLLGSRNRLNRAPLSRGDVVLCPLERIINRGILGRQGEMMVQIVGLPGEKLQIREGMYLVNGIALQTELYPVPEWLQRRSASIIIPDGHYFISTSYEANIGNLDENYIKRACLRTQGDFSVEAFIHWNPVRRRGFLRETP